MKHKLLFSVFLSLFFFQLSLVLEVSAQSGKVDAYIKSEMQRQNIPGLSLAVVKEGKVIKAKSYGLANVETNVPVTTETVFKIGSISKPIIAEGIMMLVEEGKISLDDKVGKYLEGTPESWKDITVRHCCRTLPALSVKLRVLIQPKPYLMPTLLKLPTPHLCFSRPARNMNIAMSGIFHWRKLSAR